MTVSDVIEFVDTVKPNAFPPAVKIRWISQLEGRIASEVFLMAPEEMEQFNYAALDVAEAEKQILLVNFPYDDIYPAWLKAMVDYENGEYNKYQNTMQQFNERFNSFVAWFANAYEPANSYYFPHLTKGGVEHGNV